MAAIDIQTGEVLEARSVMCDAAHNLTVDLGCMRGVIPREDGALGIRDGSVRDIAIISRVNRPVCFTVTGFRTDRSGAEYAVLSRENAQKKCMESFISSLRKGDVVDAKITHLESFGAFADIGCGIVALNLCRLCRFLSRLRLRYRLCRDGFGLVENVIDLHKVIQRVAKDAACQ